MSTPADLAAELRRRLESTRNPDGGWPYYPGKRSRLEPTCLALLALEATGAGVDAAVLRAWPRERGLFLDPMSREVNYAFNGLALVVAMRPAMGLGDLAPGLASGIIAAKGIRIGVSGPLRQDGTLQAWPWRDGTFSWVEPTAWCLLALKKWRLRHPTKEAAERVDIGERMLVDRVCPGGGWNYGNSNVLGQQLRAFVPTTALGVVALQDRGGWPAVVDSVRYLRVRRFEERSAISIGLARIALTLLDQAAGDEDETLVKTWGDTRYLDSIHGAAAALLAIAGAGSRYGALRVS